MEFQKHLKNASFQRKSFQPLLREYVSDKQKVEVNILQQLLNEGLTLCKKYYILKSYKRKYFKDEDCAIFSSDLFF